MSALRPITIAFAAAALLSSGCCLTKSCGSAAFFGAGPGCGSTAMASSSCDGGCGVIPCAGGGAHGSCLGLGCLGKLFGISYYGGGGRCADIASGCGETYYHDWISDPPCPDPCDGGGHWTGGAGLPCGGCGGDCDASGGIAGDVFVDPGCGAIGTSYGLAGAPCSQGGYGGRPCFQRAGRLFYHTWTGVGRFLHGIKLGLLPVCHLCDRFSTSQQCVACSGSPHAEDLGVAYYNGTDVSNDLGVPHEIVTQQIQNAHGRPPHKVLSNRRR